MSQYSERPLLTIGVSPSNKQQRTQDHSLYTYQATLQQAQAYDMHLTPSSILTQTHLKHRNILNISQDLSHQPSTNPQSPTTNQFSSGSWLPTLKSLPRRTHTLPNITALLKTQFPLVHSLIKKYFNYKTYNKEDQHSDIFLMWMDSYVSEEFIKRLKGYQRVNHFPCSNQLGKKHLLATNLNTAKTLVPQQFQFYPKTWILPRDVQSLKEESESGEKCFIVKPYASCQGRGIYLTCNPQPHSKEECIVQEYVQKPMLLDGCKFDLRIYVLLRSLQPLRIYLYKQGLCRLATSPYADPTPQNITNQKMHLTNYAVNRCSPNFISNKDITDDHIGHKRSLTSTLRLLAEKGYDTGQIQQKIEAIVVKTIVSAYKKIAGSYRRARQPSSPFKPKQAPSSQTQEAFRYKQDSEQPSVCFQLLGFDIMLLENGQPMLLEVNHHPSLSATSPLDQAIKRCLIMDTINLLNIDEQDREKWQKAQEEGSAYRVKNIEEKEMWQMGGYQRIYPLSHRITGQPAYDANINKITDSYNRLLESCLSGGRKINKMRFVPQGSRKNNNHRLHITKYLNSYPKQSTSHSQGSKRKELECTFYEMFNSSLEKAKDKESQPIEDSMFKNHVILVELEKESRRKLKDAIKDHQRISLSLDKTPRQSLQLHKIEGVKRGRTIEHELNFKKRSLKNGSFSKDNRSIKEETTTINIERTQLPKWTTLSKSKSRKIANTSTISATKPPTTDRGNTDYVPVFSTVEDSNDKLADSKMNISQCRQSTNFNKILLNNSIEGKSVQRQSGEGQYQDRRLKERVERINNLKVLKTHIQKLKLAHMLNRREELNFTNIDRPHPSQ